MVNVFQFVSIFFFSLTYTHQLFTADNDPGDISTGYFSLFQKKLRQQRASRWQLWKVTQKWKPYSRLCYISLAHKAHIKA
ncbi:MAG: hypothetical protein COA42_11385 [Alteromonadaceae bacterium]|nr:MAG: hypothetical protein COA42_11385 [Alteromonadaceae bacterium]